MTDTPETPTPTTWTTFFSTLPSLAFQAASDAFHSRSGALLAFVVMFGVGAYAMEHGLRNWMERHNFVAERSPVVVPTTLQCPNIRLDPLLAKTQAMAEGTDVRLNDVRTDIAARLVEMESRLAIQIKDLRPAVPAPFETQVSRQKGK